MWNNRGFTAPHESTQLFMKNVISIVVSCIAWASPGHIDESERGHWDLRAISTVQMRDRDRVWECSDEERRERRDRGVDTRFLTSCRGNPRRKIEYSSGRDSRGAREPAIGSRGYKGVGEKSIWDRGNDFSMTRTERAERWWRTSTVKLKFLVPSWRESNGPDRRTI